MADRRDNIAARLDFDATGASPSAVRLPNGDVAATSATLTVHQDDIDENANMEQLQFWSGIENDGRFSYVDPSVFANSLSEDELLQDDSFLEAARILYNERNGANAWEDRVVRRGWDADKANEELGEWALQEISDANFQMWEAGDALLNAGNKSDEELVAMLYLRRLVEHKEMNWTGGVARGAWSMVTDPVNIGILALGIIGTPFTGGASLLGAGAALTGRAALSAGTATAGRFAATRALATAVQNRVVGQVGSRIASNSAMQAVTNNVVARGITHIATRPLVYRSAVWGVPYGVGFDAGLYRAENRATVALGYEGTDYTLRRAAWAGGFGFATGGAFGIGLHGAGVALRPVGQRIGRGISNLRQNWANRNATNATNAAPNQTGAGAGTAATQGTPPNATGAAATNAAPPPNATSAATANAAPTPPPPGGGAAARVASAAAGASGIDLPVYNNGVNWFTLYLKRSWNPYKAFTKWIPNRRSAPTDPMPVLRPLINSVDNSMSNHGLVDAIRILQRDMDNFAAQLRAHPNQQARILQQVDDRIAQFSRDHANALTAFENDMSALRTHVGDTYITRTEYRALNGLGPNDPVPSNRAYVLEANDGRQTGLLHVLDDAGEVVFSHRDAVLAYLDDMRNMANNLRRADFGVEGARVRDLANAGDNVAVATEISNSLNKMTELATGTYRRLDSSGAQHKLQEVRALERALAEGYYNRFSRRTKPADMNVEHTWQQLEERFTKVMNDSGEPDWTVPRVNAFVQDFKSMYDNGFDHEAIYTIRMLRMRRGDAGIATYPTDLVQQLRTDARYNTNHHFRAWADRVAEAADISQAPGHRVQPFGPGREAEKIYAEDSYFYRYARRYANTDFLAKPGKITLMREGIAHPIMKFGYYFLGAAKTSVREGPGYFRVVPVWSSHKDGGNFGLWNNPFRRSVTRIATGGLLSKPGYYTAGAGAGLMLAGTGLEYATDYATDGEFSTDLGLRTVGKIPFWIGMTGADLFTSNTWGRVPILPDHPYADLYDYVVREDITEEQALQALSQFQLVNGEVQPLTEGNRSLATIYNSADLVALLADRDHELTRDNIQDAVDELEESGGRYNRRSSGEDTEERGRDGDRERDGERDGGRDSGRDSERDSGRDSSRDSDREERRERSAYGERFRRASSGSDGWLAAGGDFVSDVARTATDWDGDGRPDGMMGQAGTFLSGGFNAIGGFIGDLANGRIAGGEGWLAGGIGILAGLIGTGILKSLIPGADKIPFLGLVLFGLIATFGGKLAYQTMTSQGSGRHRPAGADDTDSDHDGNRRPGARRPIRIASNTPGLRDSVFAVDDDLDDKWALQVTMDGEGGSFAPNNFRQLTSNNVTDAIIAQARRDNTYIDNDYLRSEADEASEWEYDAVTHNGNSMIVLHHENAPEGAPAYYVIDVDDPQPAQ